MAGLVVLAFAWPHLRAGSRVLTPRGEQVVGRLGGPLRSRVWPRLKPVVQPAARTVAGPVRAARQRLEPVLEPVIRAVEEGYPVEPPRSSAASAPAVQSAQAAPSTPVPPGAAGSPAGSPGVVPARSESTGEESADDDDPAHRTLLSSLGEPDRTDDLIQPFRAGRAPARDPGPARDPAPASRG
ncbi:MAG TPA: hypothetical protein VI248_29820 [Kineosporiaceae bacterium]